MKNLLYLTLFIFFASCSLYREMVSKPKVNIVTSVKGAQVYSSHGKLLGQTPLHLDMNTMQNEMDGEFLTLVVEKEGYLSRVVFFELNRSLDLKIDLQKDQFFDSNKYRLIKKELGYLQSENKMLKSALDKRALEPSGETRAITQTNVKPALKKRKRAPSAIKLSKSKKLESYKMLKSKNVIAGSKHLKRKDLNSLVDEYIAIQNLIYFRKFTQARHDLIEIDKKYPNLISTINLLAYIEIQLGEYQTAKIILDRAYRLKKANSTTTRIKDALSAVFNEERGA